MAKEKNVHIQVLITHLFLVVVVVFEGDSIEVRTSQSTVITMFRLCLLYDVVSKFLYLGKTLLLLLDRKLLFSFIPHHR